MFSNLSYVGLTNVTDAEKEHLVPFLGSYETLDVQKKHYEASWLVANLFISKQENILDLLIILDLIKFTS